MTIDIDDDSSDEQTNEAYVVDNREHIYTLTSLDDQSDSDDDAEELPDDILYTVVRLFVTPVDEDR